MEQSVDDIHHEAHAIIDELQANLKDLQVDNVPTIVQENDGIDDKEITNDDILGPLIQRQHEHQHNDHDGDDMDNKQKKNIK